ncbi:MAG: AAA family ATPase, partial [Anaerolineae bacterium]
MSVPLLTTKLYIPPRRPGLVLRPRLLERLDEALHLRQKLTLVSAKAGAGKTTLVSEWLHQQQRSPAWLSLDANDSEPQRFARYLVAALNEVDITLDRNLAGQWQTPERPSAESLVVELINDVVANLPPFVLVLDDYHLVQDEWPHQAVEFLIENQPPTMHLIIITRVDPPLPLARFRGRGQITEIRDQDLRFTAGEASQFLNDVMGLALSARAVTSLEQRTEGWIAGLQMAALSMRGHRQDDARAAFIEAFRGTNRYILDYLMEEVLDQQSPAVHDFLIETSILERMCAALCDDVRFGPRAQKDGGVEAKEQHSEAAARDSQAILAHLERTNLFVQPLDNERRWYRYHHLFADLLRSTLGQRRSEQEIRELHRRASQWHQQAGSLEEAMSHAMAGQDFERAASMIEESFTSMFSRSEVPVLLNWIEQLPKPLVHNRPWIDIYRANTLALSGQLDQVDSLLDGVEQRIEPEAPQGPVLLGHIAAVRAYAANLRGDAARTIEMATLTHQYLTEAHLSARGMAAYALADAYFAVDDLDGAHQALLGMLKIGAKTEQLLVIVPALCDLANIKKVQGQLHQVEELYNRVYQWLVEQGGLDSRERCAYEFGMADLLREWNHLDAAYEHARRGMEFRRRLGGYWVVGDLPWMRILQARGDVEAALNTLREAEQIMQTHHFQMATTTAFKVARVEQWLAVGDMETASRWAEECKGGSELEQIALARLWLAQGRAADAQNLLDRQSTLAEAGGRSGRWIEILGLQAMALDAMNRPDEAEAALYQALARARPEGYVRLFLDMGWPLCEVLMRLAPRGPAAKPPQVARAPLVADYVHTLLDAFRQERTAQGSLSSEMSSLEPLLDTGL